jgi:flavin reductase (DIM6/NTAB) family NADH-FMN oxidoreductase RutF
MLEQCTNAQANNKKYPEWIVLISSISKDGKPNVMTAGWCMCTSHSPLLYAISVAPQRYTHKLLMEVPEFVLAAPKFELAESSLYVGTKSGRDEDKIKAANLVIKPALKVKPYLIGGCVFNMECKVVSTLETGDHTIFVGEVLQSHISDSDHMRILNFGSGVFAAPLPDGNLTFKF